MPPGRLSSSEYPRDQGVGILCQFLYNVCNQSSQAAERVVRRVQIQTIHSILASFSVYNHNGVQHLKASTLTFGTAAAKLMKAESSTGNGQHCCPNEPNSDHESADAAQLAQSNIRTQKESTVATVASHANSHKHS